MLSIVKMADNKGGVPIKSTKKVKISNSLIAVVTVGLLAHCILI